MASSSKAAKRLYEEFYEGVFRKCATGYSLDESLREVCASGGLLTTLLCHRLSHGQSDGALVARLSFHREGSIRPFSFLAVSEDEIKASAGSIYTDFDHVRGVVDILKRSTGVFDVVALPCQISRLRKLMENDAELKKKVGILIGLWCGHATESSLLETLLVRWNIDVTAVETFKYRTGKWRGRTKFFYEGGAFKEVHFSKGYGLYQNMYADCASRCFSCTDHFGESADVSFGDCWIRSEKKSPFKKTMALSFTLTGDDAVDMLLSSPDADVCETDPAMAVESQKRSVIFHTYSCAAREKLKKTFGMSIGCSLNLRPVWRDYVSAFLTLLYFRMFAGRFRGLMFRLPWWFLFPGMAFQKLMLNR